MAERNDNIEVIPATPADGPAIARLLDLAGEGIPRAIWSGLAPAGQDPVAFGAERVAMGGRNFCWRNCDLLRTAGEVAGLLLAYPLPADGPDLDGLHPLELPLARLEAQVPGSFYINAIAVAPAQQRRGLGSRLLRHAHARAAQTGHRRTTLIVFAHNRGALALYQQLGYREVARERPLADPRFAALGPPLLLERAV